MLLFSHYFFYLNNSMVCQLWLYRLQTTEILFLNELKINFISFIASIQHVRLNDRLFLIKKEIIEVKLIYNVVFISAVQQWFSYRYMYFFHILSLYGLSQDTEYSSLCYNSTNLLFIHYIYVVVCIC